MPLKKPKTAKKSDVKKAVSANIAIMINSGYDAKRAVAAGLTITEKLTPRKKTPKKK